MPTPGGRGRLWNSARTQLQQTEPGKRGLGGEAGEAAMGTVIRGIKARRWTSDAILGKAGC